ncbi:hypothetical protein NTGHW29_740040 [Candidatus Nitrotoga sp. HW29]|nr:hypothetical protein NTGHW29_740040 [Candidatus Nitrotoga sp. HW29]
MSILNSLCYYHNFLNLADMLQSFNLILNNYRFINISNVLAVKVDMM